MSTDPGSLSRLVGVKQALGLSPKEPPPKSEEISPPGGIDCINCGYNQEGQRVDRCPECGLPLASRLRDATAWSASGPPALGWWETARRVWLWDRRTRIRTSFVPINPESQRFAKWSVLMSAPCFGLAMGVASQMSSGPRLLTATYFLWLSIVGTVLAGLLLCLMLFGLTLAVRGTWRRGLRFVPSSVHYACAWWPPVSLAALVVSFIQVAWRDSEPWPMGIVLLLGLLLWGLWLWGSATEAQHVPQVAVRIIAVTLALSVASFAVMLSVPGYSQRAAAQLVARADSGLLKLNVFGTFTASSVHHRPQTYALIIDMIPSDDEQLVLDGITQLGAPAENRVEIRRKGCTLEQIEKALTTARSELRPEDRFILYINGHGAQQGAGAIAMADGQITSQKLADLLSQLPTTRCLVVIESCFGGKFLPALRDACNATVITSTDNRNLAYRNCLRDFWVALEKATCDQNGDGKVTVNEAFWSAYCELLERGETARQMVLRRVSGNKQRTELLTESGYATPQLEAVGKASKEDFSVPSKQNGRK